MSSDDPINTIFFEHQQAALCAQHALNMLLQKSFFTYQNLHDLARQMDELENDIVGNGANAVGRSENMNDSGFFSIQVIEKALEVFSLTLTNIENPVMAAFKQNPLTSRAYICNLREHWFVLRKFGDQWFELNSVKRGPKLLSNTYVVEFMHQLSAEGYSIFVVQGILPQSEADDLISICPVVVKSSPRKEPKPENAVQKFFNSVGRKLGSSSEPIDSQEDKDLAIAMAMSMEAGRSVDSEDADLEKAIKMSLGVKSREGSVEKKESTEEEGSMTSETAKDLEKALAMSMETIPMASASSAVTETPILGKKMSSETDPERSPAASSGTSGASPMSTGSTGPSGSSASSSPNSVDNKPSAEQQRRDRAKFLERFEEKNKKKEQ